MCLTDMKTCCAHTERVSNRSVYGACCVRRASHGHHANHQCEESGTFYRTLHTVYCLQPDSKVAGGDRTWRHKAISQRGAKQRIVAR